MNDMALVVQKPECDAAREIDHATQAVSTNEFKVGRRGFLKTCAALGGGLLINVTLPHNSKAGTVQFPAFIVIYPDSSIKIISPGAEMGQGINSGLAQVLSEELPLNWQTVTTIPAPFGSQFAVNGGQITGGSQGIRTGVSAMAQAGAVARELLILAAKQDAALKLYASTTFVAVAAGATLSGTTAVENSIIDNLGHVWTYGSLASAAAQLSLDVLPATKTSNYTSIGQRVPRPDVRLKVNGQAVFGLDIRLPNMRFAAVRHAPTLGANVATMGSAPSGMTAVNLGNAVAVVSSNTYSAINAVRGLAVTWSSPASTALNLVDTSTQSSAASALLSSSTAFVAELKPNSSSVANVKNAVSSSSKKINTTYSFPMLAHACMEVLNCTVRLTWTSGRITFAEVWCPTQAPDWVAGTVASLTGLKDGNGNPDQSRISVTTTYLGGGFGRKIEQDFVAQAVRVALALKNNDPVQLMWPREEDFARDLCRPAGVSQIQAGLDANGNITAWYNRIVAPSVMRSHGWAGGATSSFADSVAIGSAVGNGSEPMPYANAMPLRAVDYVEQTTGFTTGFWRSVGQSISCFAVESAVDELSVLAGSTPYVFRQKLLSGNTPALNVLNRAYVIAGGLGKNTSTSGGTVTDYARGIALSPGFGSLAAVVAEVYKAVTSTTVNGVTTSKTVYGVSKLFCAIDCGIAINPDEVEAQVQGGMIQAMSAARWGRMQYDKGIAQIKNFGDYKLARMADAPKVKIEIVNQGSPIGGVGEVAVPPVFPALANAYFALTGTRKRSLPLGF